MRSKSESFLTNLNGHSLAATLGKKKNELIAMIRNSEFFDQPTLKAFDQSRNQDLSYLIKPSDPVLINNIKSAVNIMNSLEILLPHGIDPILSIIQSDFAQTETQGYAESVFNGVYDYLKILGHGVNLAYNLGPNYSTVLSLIKEANDLSFYMNELKSTLTTLPLIDSNFLPLISNLNESIGRDIEPLLSQIKLFSPFKSHKIAPVDNQKKELKFNDGMFDSVYDNLEPIIKNIRTHLAKHGEKQANELYEVNYQINQEVASLMHAHNALVSFTVALKKLESTSSMKSVYLPSTILMDLGRAITELEKIDFEHIKDLNAKTLHNVLNTVTEKLDGILTEMVRNFEYAEISLDLKDESLQNKLTEICSQFGV